MIAKDDRQGWMVRLGGSWWYILCPVARLLSTVPLVKIGRKHKGDSKQARARRCKEIQRLLTATHGMSERENGWCSRGWCYAPCDTHPPRSRSIAWSLDPAACSLDRWLACLE
eukprot:821389-Rhodomonas_salina.2